MAAGSGEGQEHAVKHAAAQAENVFKATVQAQAETRPRGDKTDPSTSYVQQQAAALRQFAKVKPECNVCGTETKRADIARLPCGAHLFCKGCLKDHFLRAVNDQSLFPPHCCRKPIPLSMISAQLSASEVQAYKDAELEHTTPHKIYCSNPRCSKFIPPLRITKHKAKCKCGHSTCPRCKRPAHAKGDGCPEDPDLADVLKLGKKRGWQRCAKCLQMVEKTEGCDHMTCQCKYEFCYVCGGAYQKCKCVTGA
ncbi:hypothetical protein EJ06DRAFT_483040 [Trichodelitschia bisporula]|uniref:RBR-type E3 ubiquitin transferase n=1 Tax=Trichodelitschia bisporula TaxID=703511 RepID=A0A6G1HLL9_9PEZI|nr:hypothetical protein EJ06DRAFT_483040 [Trichodelitschia bisporula]